MTVVENDIKTEEVKDMEIYSLYADKEDQKKYHRNWYQAHKKEVKERGREWRKAHPEQCREQKKRWRKANPLKDMEQCKKYRRKVKGAVFHHYGSSCRICGTTKNLEIDHIYENGTEHREELGLIGHDFYRWIIKNDFPDDLQVLCNKCNARKSRLFRQGKTLKYLCLSPAGPAIVSGPKERR